MNSASSNFQANTVQAPPASQSFAAQERATVAPRNDFAQTKSNEIVAQPVLPKRHVLPSASPDELARKAQQLRQRLEKIEEPVAQTVGNAIQATNDVVGNSNPNVPVGYTQGAGNYPTTNFAAYNGQERISQVTPIPPVNPAQTMPVLQAHTNPNSTLPLNVIKGNGTYAPGSVKSLAPIQ